MESCSFFHSLGHQFQQLGNDVRLIPPHYVKTYLKTNKNDYIDADAITEAAMRPNMCFVCIKFEEAQMTATTHRISSSYIK